MSDEPEREAQLRQLAVDAQLAREAATQALFEGRELAARLKEVEHRLATDPMLAQRAIDRMFEITERMKWLEGRLAASENRVRDMQASTSWRITGPLRWIVALLRGELRARPQPRETAASPQAPAAMQPAPTHAPAPLTSHTLTASAQRARDVIVHVTKDEATAKKDD